MTDPMVAAGIVGAVAIAVAVCVIVLRPLAQMSARELKAARRDLHDEAVRAIFDVWLAWTVPTGKRGMVPYRLTPARRAMIEDALERTGDDWGLCMAACAGWRHDPWPGRVHANDITDCLSPANLERFATWHREASPELGKRGVSVGRTDGHDKEV